MAARAKLVEAHANSSQAAEAHPCFSKVGGAGRGAQAGVGVAHILGHSTARGLSRHCRFTEPPRIPKLCADRNAAQILAPAPRLKTTQDTAKTASRHGDSLKTA